MQPGGDALLAKASAQRSAHPRNTNHKQMVAGFASIDQPLGDNARSREGILMQAAAVKAYNHAAKLYLDRGKILPSMVAKISQWHIEMPSDQQVQSFLSELNSTSDNQTLPLGHFFYKLSIQELKALCSLFENRLFLL